MGEAAADAFLVVGQVEGEGQRLNLIEHMDEIPDVPWRGAVCTLGGFVDADDKPDASKAKPLIDAGFMCFTECYIGDNHNATPPRMDFTFGVQLGWGRTYPVFGIYDAPLSDYESWMAQWPEWSIYLVGYLP